MILLILHTSLIKSFIRKSIPRAYDLNALSESAELCWMTGTMLLGGIRVFIFRICWKHLNCYQFIFWKLQYWRDWSDIYYMSFEILKTPKYFKRVPIYWKCWTVSQLKCWFFYFETYWNLQYFLAKLCLVETDEKGQPASKPASQQPAIMEAVRPT